VTSQKPAQEVARLLKVLLWRREYAAEWQARQLRAQPSKLNQTAIAQVIAEHLWQAGEWSEADMSLPGRLKYRLNRALLGKGVSQQTLGWIIDAFGMTHADAAQLYAALNPAPLMAESPVDTLGPQRPLPVPQNHRTVFASEYRVIGPDGALVRHRACHLIRAEDGVVCFYPCRSFSRASRVDMLRGGKITGRRESAGSSPILEMALSTPLSVGDVAVLEYEAIFEPDAGVVTEYRRVAHARASNLDIVVQFAAERLPRRVWWAIWDNHRGGTMLDQQPVRIDSEGCVHRYLAYLENAAAGFHWEW
jgi:hypothetical protein